MVASRLAEAGPSNASSSSHGCLHLKEQAKAAVKLAAARTSLLAYAPSEAGITGDAVLIELRPLHRTTTLLANVRLQLPADRWLVHFRHGAGNAEPVRASPALAPAIAAGSLLLQQHRVGGKLMTAPMAYKEYTAYLVSAEFWTSFSRQQLLLLEPDTVLCPSPSVPLQAFSRFAFVGAPWEQAKEVHRAEYRKNRGFPSWCFNLGSCVGNCGLSLWRRDVVAAVLTNYTEDELKGLVLDYLEQPGCYFHKRRCQRPKQGSYNGQMPAYRNRRYFFGRVNGSVETSPPDVWLTRVLQALHASKRLPAGIAAVPSENEAALFSVETAFAGSYTPVGAHKPFRYLTPLRLSQLLHRCPPVRDLLEASQRDAKLDHRAFLGVEVAPVETLANMTCNVSTAGAR